MPNLWVARGQLLAGREYKTQGLVLSRGLNVPKIWIALFLPVKPVTNHLQDVTMVRDMPRLPNAKMGCPTASVVFLPVPFAPQGLVSKPLPHPHRLPHHHLHPQVGRGVGVVTVVGILGSV